MPLTILCTPLIILLQLEDEQLYRNQSSFASGFSTPLYASSYLVAVAD